MKYKGKEASRSLYFYEH